MPPSAKSSAPVRPVTAALALLAAALAAPSSHGRPPPGAAPGPPAQSMYGGRSGRLGIGLGVVHSSEPYCGFSRKIILLPMLTYFDRNLMWVGPQASYRLADVRDLSVRALLRYDFSGYEGDDSPLFEGMANRDGSLEAGLMLDQAIDRNLGVRVSLTTDVLGTHDGEEIRAAVRYRFRVGKLAVTPALGVTWQGAEKVDYYFGVPPAEAAAGRPAYDADAALNWEIGVSLLYFYNSRITLVALPRLDYLDAPIRDSPLVSGNLMLSGILGLSYSL